MSSKNKAQSLLTYVFLIVVVLAALLVMKVFLTRSVQEKYRQSADLWGRGEQYEPGRSTATYSGSSWENKKAKCPEILTWVAAMQEELNLLRANIEKQQREVAVLERRAVSIEERAKELTIQAQAMEETAATSPLDPDEIEAMLQNAAKLRATAESLLLEAGKIRTEEEKKQAKIEQAKLEILRIEEKIQQQKASHPECF